MTRIIGKSCRVKVYGLENIPENKPFILASNHNSYFDPPFVACWFNREMFFLGKRNLFKLPLIGLILKTVHAIPLNRNAIDRKAIALCMKALDDNYGLVVFPEGTRSRTDDFLKPKAGLGMLAIMSGSAIVPTYIRGTGRLVACMLGKEQLSISYGEPLSAEWVSSFSAEKESYVKISVTVMERIAKLKQNVLSLK